MKVDRETILSEANKNKSQQIDFLRELIAIPATSGNEEQIARRIKAEMEKVGFDKIIIDKMGNIIGKIGSGKTIILMDAHIDTVDTGDLSEWKIDPFKGDYKNGIIYGRGASDQLAGMASMIYAVKLIKKFNLFDDFTLYISGTCHEEACEGLCMYHILDTEKLFKPDFVLLTEPTNLKIALGHPGRMEMKIKARGKACHSSRPEQGINAIYLINPVIESIKELNDNLITDDFMGKGTIAVTKIECQTPAQCAIPNETTIYIDRRLTIGENKELVISQLKDIINAQPNPEYFSLEVLNYQAKAWTGMDVEMEKYFPGWKINEEDKLARASIEAAEITLGKKPEIGKWAFSTNGTATMGTMNIPTIGFGPADDVYAHTVDDQVPEEHLVLASVFYAILPAILNAHN